MNYSQDINNKYLANKGRGSGGRWGGGGWWGGASVFNYLVFINISPYLLSILMNLYYLTFACSQLSERILKQKQLHGLRRSFIYFFAMVINTP